MALKDMAELMRRLPKQQEMMRGYKIHTDLLGRVTQSLQTNKNAKIVDLEQKIVSGLQNSLAVDKVESLKISNTQLVKEISQTSKELQPRDYLRVIMLYFSCFDLAPKDKNTLLKSLQKETYREILQNMEFLDSSIASATKFRRKHPIMTANELQEFSLRNQKAAFKIVKC
mmetsp:Transcript_28941/g.35822  ORF Transcript_28941/g.35822 Transcript_28941/m.35822 type:complete len:171 (+) Transcript_28941:1170-1682(+)